MHQPIPHLRRVLCLLSLLVILGLPSTTTTAAVMPAALADSSATVASGTAGALLDVESNSRLEAVLFPALATYVLTQHFPIALALSFQNSGTDFGGPYPLTQVFLYIVLSQNLLFLECVNYSGCTSEPDPETGGTRVTVPLGDVGANQTKDVEISVGAEAAGEATIEVESGQFEWDPDPSDNFASFTFDVSQPENGKVRGFKYEDLNGNGVWEDDEPGLNGWTIELLQEETSRTTVTDALDGFGDGVTSPLEDGWFEFADVVPGAYQLHEQLMEGWVQSEPEEVYYELEVEPGETDGNHAFGNYRPAQILGSVYHDADSNGEFGAGDAGLAGRTIALSGTDGKGNVVSGSTTTAQDGTYGFDDLPPGAYQVTTTAPDDFPSATSSPGTVYLTSGMTAEAVDFGFAPAPAPRLEVSMNPSAVNTVVGALVPITARVTNTGSEAATGTMLGISYDPRAQEEEGSDLPQNCDGAMTPFGSFIECPVGDLAPGASAELDFQFRARRAYKTNPGFYSTIEVGAEADNHPFVDTAGFIRATELDIDLGVFRAGGDAGRKRAAGEVDVYLDSTLVAESVAEGTSTGLEAEALLSTNPMLHVVAAGESDLSRAQFATQLTFGEGDGDDFFLPTSYLLILAGSDAVHDAIVVPDVLSEASDPGKVAITLVHAAPELGDATVQIDGGGGATLQPGEGTGYIEIDPGVHRIDVTGDDAAAAFEVDWSASAGAAMTLVLTADAGGPALSGVSANGSVTQVPAANPTQTQRAELPDQLTLHANYPNPFNPVTTIAYALPAPAEARLEVFDALGRRVAVLAHGLQEAGRHEVSFSASELPSGVYVYRLTSGDVVRQRTLVLLK